MRGIVQWDRVNTLAFRRILEYFVAFGTVVFCETRLMDHTVSVLLGQALDAVLEKQ